MKRTNIDATQLELADTVVAIKRVSKTVKGGRTMRFSALVVVGDKNGHVGVGMGKAAEIPEAIRKGKQAAEKNMITVPLDENKSIPHDFIGKFGSAAVLLKRAPEGTGVNPRDEPTVNRADITSKMMLLIGCPGSRRIRIKENTNTQTVAMNATAYARRTAFSEIAL